MNKEEAIKMIVETKAVSAFTRNFVEWLYKNGYIICNTNFDQEWEDKLQEIYKD